MEVRLQLPVSNSGPSQLKRQEREKPMKPEELLYRGVPWTQSKETTIE